MTRRGRWTGGGILVKFDHLHAEEGKAPATAPNIGQGLLLSVSGAQDSPGTVHKYSTKDFALRDLHDSPAVGTSDEQDVRGGRHPFEDKSKRMMRTLYPMGKTILLRITVPASLIWTALEMRRMMPNIRACCLRRRMWWRRACT